MKKSNAVPQTTVNRIGHMGLNLASTCGVCNGYLKNFYREEKSMKIVAKTDKACPIRETRTMCRHHLEDKPPELELHMNQKRLRSFL